MQGIGHTLMENVTYDKSGKPMESSFMQYKLPTRRDMGNLKAEFEHSYEPTGPFGAKSIGEIVINTPAIAHVIYRATGKWFRELPITPEQIAMTLTEESCSLIEGGRPYAESVKIEHPLMSDNTASGGVLIYLHTSRLGRRP